MDSSSKYKFRDTLACIILSTKRPQISTDAKFFHQVGMLRIFFMVFNNT